MVNPEGKSLLMTYFAYKNFNPPLKVVSRKIKRKPYIYDLSNILIFH